MHAASSLNLGDEILAVNGQPLNGLTHKEAVAKLKGAGSSVVLRVRPNQTLGGRINYNCKKFRELIIFMLNLSTLDVFSSEIESDRASTGHAPKPHPPPLPTEHEVEPPREQEVPHPPKAAHHVIKAARGPLPPGWGEKIDLKTGRPYYEKFENQFLSHLIEFMYLTLCSHYTQTSTWTDPRSLEPIPVSSFEWNKLPLGWERHIDQHGEVYYVW